MSGERFAALGGAAILGLFVVLRLAGPALADGQTVIDLTYDSLMDMVRPEVHPGIRVHHTLQVTLSEHNKIDENSSRAAAGHSDSKATEHVLGSSGDAGSYAVWRVAAKDQLVRIERDPQSTRTMTVTLTSPTSCRLEVRDELKPGFSEYAFSRISQHSLAYFSNYRVVDASCAIH